MLNKLHDFLKNLGRLKQQDKISTMPEDEIKCESDYLKALRSMQQTPVTKENSPQQQTNN
ncbi:hypothetical protein [Halanaerobaculum tunisiense]